MKQGYGEGAPPRSGRSVVAGLCTVICTKDHSVKSKPCKATNTGQVTPVNTTPKDVVGYPLRNFYSAYFPHFGGTPPVMFFKYLAKKILYIKFSVFYTCWEVLA